MPTKHKDKQKKFETSSYEGDTEKLDSEKLENFKENFQSRVKKSAKVRRSHSDIDRSSRRLDSLARLLELDSICAAVFYDKEADEILLANNKIFQNSHLENKQIQELQSTFEFLRNKHVNMDMISDQLGDIIYKNIQKEHRHRFTELRHEFDSDEEIKNNIKKMLKNMIKSMFESNENTKHWREDTIENFKCKNDKNRNAVNKLIKRIARLARDFLKIRDFLSNPSDTASKNIVTAIRNKEPRILRTEKKDVHAEIRIIAEVAPDDQSYIGISKLCCGHCNLALSTGSRGTHGQSAKWPIPDFINNNSTHLETFLGNDAYQTYASMNQVTKKEAIKFVSSKKSNPIKGNVKQGRSMEADSSDSDIEFGIRLYNEEQVGDISRLPVDQVWVVRHINISFKKEYRRLVKLGLSLTEIIHLYKQSEEKFKALGHEQTCYLINESAEDSDSISENFEKFSKLYDENEKLFWQIIEDEDKLVLENGLENIRQRYEAKNNYCTDDETFDDEKEDTYALIGRELKEENGWDYDYNSEDSSNRWGYKDNSSETDSYPSEDESNQECDINSDIEMNEDFSRMTLGNM